MAVPELRKVVERHFRVYEAREEKLGGEVAARIFFIMFPPAEFDARFEALRTELKAVDPELVVFMRRDGGEDVLYVGQRPPPPPRDTRLAVTLLLLTILTTVMAGEVNWHGYKHPMEGLSWGMFIDPETALMGFLTFALPLMTILGVHEMAHYVTARRHGLRPSLPRFLPMPPFLLPFGTLGAFISMRDDMPDRKALFDIGASGPIAGFLVAVPLLLLGAHLTATEHQGLPDYGLPAFSADRAHNATLLDTRSATLEVYNVTPGVFSYSVVAPPRAPGQWHLLTVAEIQYPNSNVTTARADEQLAPGATDLRTMTVPAGAQRVTVHFTWDDGLTRFGDPLLIKALDAVSPAGDDVLTHPLFLAGWVGLLVTGINLLPAGQLDGGHVARALFGDRMKYAAYASVFGLLLLAFFFNSWMLMAILILWMGVNHPPPLNERTPLGTGRKIVAALVLLVFLLTFVPKPFL